MSRQLPEPAVRDLCHRGRIGGIEIKRPVRQPNRLGGARCSALVTLSPRAEVEIVRVEVRGRLTAGALDLEELAERGSNKTVGSGMRRLYFEKTLSRPSQNNSRGEQREP